MSSTYCHRCKRMMAASLPACPHCGASQDEQSRAQSQRKDRLTWLAIGVAAPLGLAVGWAVVGSAESLIAGLILGVVAGRVLVAIRHGW